MIREWATVVSWHKGIATLQYDRQSTCNGCHGHHTCGVKVLNNLLPHIHANELKIAVREQLVVGQQVELGIDESGLVKSALLVYCLPLFFLFINVFLVYYLLPGSNLAILVGMLVGIILGFLVARYWARKLEHRGRYCPIILTIKPIADH